jgi:hypothetical protein
MRTPGTYVRDVSGVRDHDSGLAERADDQRTVELTAVFQNYKQGSILSLYVDADHPTAIVFIKLSVKVLVNKLLKRAF